MSPALQHVRTKDAPGVLLGYGASLLDRTKQIPIYLPDEYRKRGTFVFGTTGVGKTFLESMIACDDIQTGKNLIIFDPKCDQRLLSTIYSEARKCGRLAEVQLITPIYPQYSASIDPMAYYYDPEELVTHAISGIQGKDPFYGAASRLFVTPIIYGNLILARAEGRLPTISLRQVYEGLKRTVQADLKAALDALPEEIAETEDAPFYSSMLESNLAKPADYYEKITTTLQSCLVPLISGNIGKIIGHADSNKLIRQLETGKGVIAVVHTGTMTSPSSAAILGRVLLSMIMATVGRHYLDCREKMEPTLSIHIDEAHAVITPDTLNILAMAGSANVMTQLYSQAVSQIYAALGSKDLGTSGLANTNTKIFMKCADIDTSMYVASHFGSRDVLSGVFSNNQVTTRQVEKTVLQDDDALNLENREAYMLTYSGKFMFKTATAPDPDCKIVFPKALTTLLSESRAAGSAATGVPR
jgi:conjugal transfer pilus assembly protein TraD